MENKSKWRITANLIIRILFSVLLIFIGVTLILLNIREPAPKLVSNLGLALIITGMVSTFYEAVIRWLEGNEAAERTADAVYKRIRAEPLSASGIKLVSPVRKGFAGYYQWAVDVAPTEMFFAGRSVLHRIAEDFQTRKIELVETQMARRLKEGSSFKILFLDPRSDLIPRLADEEGQTSTQLLEDLASSLGICERLYSLLQQTRLHGTAGLAIHIFDEVPYFSYHRVGDYVVVGFYFTSILGHASAAFEVVDLQTKEFFNKHFESILGRAGNNFIVKTNPHSGRLEINRALLDELRGFLIETIGIDRVQKKGFLKT